MPQESWALESKKGHMWKAIGIVSFLLIKSGFY